MTNAMNLLKVGALTIALSFGLAILPTHASAAGDFRTCATEVQGAHEVVQTVPGLTCGEAITIAKKSSHVDGDDGNRFFYDSTYWQCVTIARPDRGAHTEFGCYENRAGQGSPYVKITIFTQAD